VVTVLGAALYARRGVGSGYSIYEELEDRGTRTVALQFAGGSWPARAAGLNRLGFFQEWVREEMDQPAEAFYFGFMTSSKEQNLTEARKAVVSGSDGAAVYTMVQGAMRNSISMFVKDRVAVAGGLAWSDWSRLLPLVRKTAERQHEQLANSSPTAHADRTAAPLLYCVQRAMRAREAELSLPFVYESRDHRLDVVKKTDVRTGRELATRIPSVDAARVTRMLGRTTDVVTRKQGSFRLWFEERGEFKLPLRIELKPRSFLLLAFECDPALTEPPFTLALGY
jgi:hypothetical protein